MNISLNWLSAYIDLSGLGTQEMADMLTFAGIEVEGIRERGVTTDRVVVAQVMQKTPVEGSDHLNCCLVDAGEGELRQIVCGAQNYRVGDKVPCALPGAVLPGGWEIKEGKMLGIPSRGMLCSASELGLPDKEHGLWILPQDYAIGTPVRDFVPTDTLFELAITPNRPDLLSHWGMARELAGITGRALKTDPAEAPAATAQTAPAGDFVTLSVPEVCPLYTATRICGVRIAPSPEWLQERLVAIGLRPINNVVDITNYVLFELGHPLHAFDAAKLTGGLNIRRAAEGESFTSLMGDTYSLTPADTVISDASGAALALGGVMGGLDSGVTEQTTDIVLESAWFRRSDIRFTSRRLGLSSDSSYRFERGCSPWNVLRAAARAVQLILECAGGTAEPVLVRLVQGVVQAANRWWNLLTALVYGALGVLMVLQPVFSLELLTLIIGAVLLGEGALRLVLALALRSQAGMAWRVFNGLISAVLGGLVLWGWPGSSMWLLGTIIAIEMIFSGWTLLFLSVGSEERTLPEP